MSAATRVTDLYKQQRPGQVPAAEKKAATRGSPKSAAAALREAAAEEEVEQELRQFDLDSRFGPCAGASRLERWERAQKLGLQPPPNVPNLIRAHGGEASKFNINVWDHTE